MLLQLTVAFIQKLLLQRTMFLLVRFVNTVVIPISNYKSVDRLICHQPKKIISYHSSNLLPEYGFDITKEVILQLAAGYFESLNLTINLGKKWLNSFVQRHSEGINWRKQQKLEQARAENFTKESLVGRFQMLKQVVTKYSLFDKPNQIFNVDESGFSDKTKGNVAHCSLLKLLFIFIIGQ